MDIIMKKFLDSKPIYILRVILNRLSFAIFKVFPINTKKIVFLNFHSDNFTGNNKAIYDEMIKQKWNLNYVMVSNSDIRREYTFRIKKIITTIKINYNICTAKYIIVNDYYSLFSMCKLRKGTELIQVWHGGGAFKKFGKDSMQNMASAEIMKRNMRGHGQYTKVIVSSKEVAPIYANAFGVDINKIYPIGIPRADIFFDSSRMEKIKTSLLDKYPYLLDKKIILYAPTYRDDSRYNESLALNLEYLMERISDNYVFVFKMHPFERGKIKIDKSLSSKVFDLSHEEINDLLIIADILITDYSSIIFEYAILQRPMIFFAYDLEKYENEIRGFYYNYTDFVPGPIAYTTEEVVELINKNEWDFEIIRKFAIRFNEHFDGKATDRFIKEVLFEEEGKF